MERMRGGIVWRFRSGPDPRHGRYPQINMVDSDVVEIFLPRPPGLSLPWCEGDLGSLQVRQRTSARGDVLCNNARAPRWLAVSTPGWALSPRRPVPLWHLGAASKAISTTPLIRRCQHLAKKPAASAPSNPRTASVLQWLAVCADSRPARHVRRALQRAGGQGWRQPGGQASRTWRKRDYGKSPSCAHHPPSPALVHPPTRAATWQRSEQCEQARDRPFRNLVQPRNH